MSGGKLFLDTNIIIYFLSGDKTIASLIDNKTIYISFITQLELLGYHELTERESKIINDFLSDCIIVDINNNIKSKVIELRGRHRLKLPDCIILASALHFDLPLVTSDNAFNKIDESDIIYYEV